MGIRLFPGWLLTLKGKCLQELRGYEDRAPKFCYFCMFRIFLHKTKNIFTKNFHWIKFINCEIGNHIYRQRDIMFMLKRKLNILTVKVNAREPFLGKVTRQWWFNSVEHRMESSQYFTTASSFKTARPLQYVEEVNSQAYDGRNQICSGQFNLCKPWRPEWGQMEEAYV